MRLPFFAEKIRYKCRSREGGVGGDGVRWRDGIFVGVHRRTNQYLIFDAQLGIKEARTVMRFPDELKFSAEEAQAVNITPQHVHDPGAHDAAFREPIRPSVPLPVPDDRRFKDLYVRQADLEAFGYTPDCPRCKHIIDFGPGCTWVHHTDACRRRIKEALAGTEEGRRRLEAYERRTDRNIAEELRKSDEAGAQMGAPAAQGEIGTENDGRAAASSAAAPPPFSDLPARVEPNSVTAAGRHLRPAEEAPRPRPRPAVPRISESPQEDSHDIPVDPDFDQLVQDGLSDDEEGNARRGISRGHR